MTEATTSGPVVTPARGCHVLATLTRRETGDILAAEVVDLRAWHPLVKQLEYASVAREPALTGARYDLVAAVDVPGNRLQVTGVPWTEWHGMSVATIPVPLQNLRWLVEKMLVTVGQRDGNGRSTAEIACAFCMLDDDSPLLSSQGREEAVAFDGFELEEEGIEATFFPRVEDVPPDLANAPRQCGVAHADGSWLRCVFRRDVYDGFLRAAAESSWERHWVSTGSVHTIDGTTYCVLKELHELPGEADQTSIVTSGSEWAKAFATVQTQGAGQMICGYLHLHPSSLTDSEGAPRPVPAAPSPWDHQVAWNMNAASNLPVCYPIACFGSGETRTVSRDAPSLRVWGYASGALVEIDWEVR